MFAIFPLLSISAPNNVKLTSRAC